MSQHFLQDRKSSANTRFHGAGSPAASSSTVSPVPPPINLPMAATAGLTNDFYDHSEPLPAYEPDKKPQLQHKLEKDKSLWTEDAQISPDAPDSASGSNLFYNGYAPTHIPSSNKHPSQVHKFAGGKSLQKSLNPPPGCFSRAPPSDQQYPEFQMITIPSLGHQYLSKGFPATLPPSITRPHPFSTHDVTEEDWMHFLADLKAAGSLGWNDRLVSNIAPALLGTAFIAGALLSCYATKGLGIDGRLQPCSFPRVSSTNRR